MTTDNRAAAAAEDIVAQFERVLDAYIDDMLKRKLTSLGLIKAQSEPVPLATKQGKKRSGRAKQSKQKRNKQTATDE
jgi:hypothetical protein